MSSQDSWVPSPLRSEQPWTLPYPHLKPEASVRPLGRVGLPGTDCGPGPQHSPTLRPTVAPSLSPHLSPSPLGPGLPCVFTLVPPHAKPLFFRLF